MKKLILQNNVDINAMHKETKEYLHEESVTLSDVRNFT